MKKIALLLGISALMLAACEDGESTASDLNIVEEEAIVEQNEEETQVEKNILEIDADAPLENVSEYKYTSQGRVELLNITRPQETYTLVEGLNLNFVDIKILYHSEIPENEKEFFREVYGFDEEGYTAQITYSIENNRDETIGGIEVEDIVTSNGNQYNLYNNGASLHNSAYEVRPNATANFVGVSISTQDPEISGLTLYLQPYDSEGYHLEEASIELEF